jgi:hypothetical protein
LIALVKRENLLKLKEIIDNVYVRLEYLERIISSASCPGSDAWKYNVLDVLEQIYDMLSKLRKEVDELERTTS